MHEVPITREHEDIPHKLLTGLVMPALFASSSKTEGNILKR